MQIDDLFEGAAEYYSKYQPDYPNDVITFLNDRFVLDGMHRVLDLGCGTGQLGLPLAKHAGEVVCMDPDADMLTEARARARRAGAANVVFRTGGAEDVTPAFGCFRLVTMGRCFHRMPREATLENLKAVVDPEGGVAIVDKERLECEPSSWWSEMWNFVEEWHGGHLPAGKGQIRQPLNKTHGEILSASAFASVDRLAIDYSITWTVEEMVGYVLSTSRACPGVLGKRQAMFEAELRDVLRKLSSGRPLIERGITETLIGTRGPGMGNR
jgi:ubiquinone/menaquinone biosynthesis C-methylase UbiE